MICPHCGAAVGNDAKFCNCCGGTMPAQQPQYQNPQQPQYQNPQQPQYQQYQAPQYQQYQSPQYQQYQAPQYQQYQTPQYQQQYRAPAKPMTKKEFLKNPPQKAKLKSTLTLVTLILSILLIVVSAVLPLVRPIFRFRAIPVVLALADMDMREVTDELEGLFEELEVDLEESRDYMTDEEIEVVELILDTFDDLTDSLNIMGLSRLANALRTDYASLLEESMTPEDMAIVDMVVQIPTIISLVIVSSFLLPLILALLAGLKKSMGLSITALIFTLIPQVIFNGTIFVTLTLAIFITQAVLCGQLDKAYKDHQLGII